MKTIAVSAIVTPRYTFQFRDGSSWNRSADHMDYSQSASKAIVVQRIRHLHRKEKKGAKIFTVIRVDGRKSNVSTVIVFIVSLSRAASVAT